MARWTVYSDGASRGNPGPAGYGAWVRNEETGDVAELSGYLGIATNNVAEYHGLLAGLRFALDHGGGSVLVRADSELLVRQLRGEYRVRHPGLVPLYREALRLLGQFDRWTAEHVPREENRQADRLANQGIDDATGVARS
jgi:ribonuclease HI